MTIKKTVLSLLLILIVALYVSTRKKKNIHLGDPSATRVWMYLGGLMRDFNVAQEVEHRKILDTLGKNLGIAFVAVKPKHRSPHYENKLHWPHNTKEEIVRTYKEIISSFEPQNISGYIGFSNGGFFLNRLVQFQKLGVPVVSIGAAGGIGNVQVYNKIYLLIGKQDKHHFDLAKQFYQQSKTTSLDVTLIEYDGGHNIPAKLLEKIIDDLSKK